MSWRDKFTFQGKRCHTVEFGGREWRFYPNHMEYLEELKEVSEPLALAMSTLFVDKRMDLSSASEKQEDANDGSVYTKESFEGLTPETASFRDTQRTNAIKECLSGITNMRTRLLMGKLLMDSLRDDFTRTEVNSQAEVQAFMHGDDGPEGFGGLTLPTMVAFVKGWLGANAEVFGDAGKQLVDKVKTQLSAVTTGPDSKTPSSTPSDGDSVLAGSSD